MQPPSPHQMRFPRSLLVVVEVPDGNDDEEGLRVTVVRDGVFVVRDAEPSAEVPDIDPDAVLADGTLGVDPEDPD